MNLANTHSPEMVDAIVAFLAAGGPENPLGVLAEMSPQDQQRIRFFYLARIAMYDNNFYQYRNGYLDEERYQNIDALIIKNEADLWEALFYLQTPSMQSEMDRIRAE